MRLSNNGNTAWSARLILCVSAYLLLQPTLLAQQIQCQNLDQCQQVVTTMESLLRNRLEQLQVAKDQVVVLEKQNQQLRELRDGAIKELGGTQEAVVFLQRDTTSRFLQLQAESRERYDRLREQISHKDPGYVQAITWASRIAALVAAIRRH